MYTLKSDYKADADDMIHMKRQQLDSITTCNRVIAFLIWLAVAAMLFGAFESICFSEEKPKERNDSVIIGTSNVITTTNFKKPTIQLIEFGSPPNIIRIDVQTGSVWLEGMIPNEGARIFWKSVTETYPDIVRPRTGIHPLHLLWIIPLSIIAGIILMIWFILTRMDVDDRKEVK